MTYVKILVLVMMVITVIGCGTKDPLQPTQTSSVIMPLQVGNTWIYNVNIYTPTSPNPVDTLNWTIKVVAREDFDNRAWYRSLHIITDGVYYDTMVTYYSNFPNGLYLSYLPSDTSFLKLLYPANPGDTFTAVNEIYMASGLCELVAVNVPVSVPLNNYQCSYYRMIYSSTRIMHDYYKPDLGMVKTEWEYYNTTYGWYTDVKFELIGATLQ